MKVSVLILTFSLFLLHFSPAQTPEYNHKLGVRFSAGRGGYSGLSPDYFPAFSIGLQYLKKFHPNLTIATGLNFTSMRTDYNGSILNFRHLQLPLALRFETRAFYFEGGIFADYLVLVNNGQSAFSPLDPKRNIAFGLNAAAGYELELSEKLNLLLELRFLSVLRSSAPILGGAGYYGFRTHTLGIGINYEL
jgi:hypothetical protein